MNRREFLAAGSAAMAMTAKSYAQIAGANDRVGLGIIGVGRRGSAVGAAFVADPRTRLVAIADVYDAKRKQALSLLPAGAPAPATYDAHEDLLARSDVDAVLIASPDHLHVTLARAALAAGKHVYLEKPTLHRWHERSELVEVAKRSGRLLQCGMQQRSGAHYQRVREEFFASNRLGDVVVVRAVWHNFPWQCRNIPDAPQPPGLDWQRFLGPAPRVPYETVRYDSWRYFHAYGNGLLADILTHWIDVAQWMMNDAAPQSAYANGGIYKLYDQRDNPDTVSAVVKYANWNLNFESSVLPLRDERPSVLFEGTAGLLEVARDGYVFTPHSGQPERVDVNQSLERAHTGNFLDALTHGAALNAPLEAGIAASRPVLMAVESYWAKSVVTSLQESA